MALQLILGNPGAGKSHYLFEKVIRGSMQYPEKQFLVIVPEQFTMQTQKDLVRMHPRHGIMNIDVLSFERLAHRVFGEVGGEHRRILEDTGKNLILRRIAEEKKDELVLLGGNLKKLGYISEVKSLLSEFTQYRMQPEELRRVMEQNKENPQLYFKLKDMLVIYESFREYLEGMYLTVEELLDALEQVVERSETVWGSVIALDGYNGFTPVQMKLLGAPAASGAFASGLAFDLYVRQADDVDLFRVHPAELPVYRVRTEAGIYGFERPKYLPHDFKVFVVVQCERRVYAGGGEDGDYYVALFLSRGGAHYAPNRLDYVYCTAKLILYTQGVEMGQDIIVLGT